jgi:hypothetical protein
MIAGVDPPPPGREKKARPVLYAPLHPAKKSGTSPRPERSPKPFVYHVAHLRAQFCFKISATSSLAHGKRAGRRVSRTPTRWL